VLARLCCYCSSARQVALCKRASAKRNNAIGFFMVRPVWWSNVHAAVGALFMRLVHVARCLCVLPRPWQALFLRRPPITALPVPQRGSSAAGAATGHAAAATEHAHLRPPGQRGSCYLNLLAVCSTMRTG